MDTTFTRGYLPNWTAFVDVAGVLFMDNTEEIWLPIKDFDGYYDISSYGRVRSVDRIVTNSRCGTQKVLGKILNLSMDRYGYCKVVLSKNGIVYYFTAHRLVAQTFLPNPENKKTVNHKNGVKTDNWVGNLEWATESENTQHAHAHGLVKKRLRGNNNFATKVINTNTEKVFDCIIDAHEEYGTGSYNAFVLQLLGTTKNRTPYKYYNKA